LAVYRQFNLKHLRVCSPQYYNTSTHWQLHLPLNSKAKTQILPLNILPRNTNFPGLFGQEWQRGLGLLCIGMGGSFVVTRHGPSTRAMHNDERAQDLAGETFLCGEAPATEAMEALPKSPRKRSTQAFQPQSRLLTSISSRLQRHN
jgi:hypothetical protein